MFRAEDYVHILSDAPRGRWIALSQDESRVVGIGETMREAVIAAAESGVDEPVLIRMPSLWERHSKTIN